MKRTIAWLHDSRQLVFRGSCKGKELFSTHAMLLEPNREPRKSDWSLAVGSYLGWNVHLGLVSEVCRSMLVK